MNPNAAIDMLTQEHKIILKVVEGLRGIAVSLRAGHPVDVSLLRDAVTFMREFADRCHHAKEEDLLFPAFVAHGVPQHGCPIDALLHEHQQGRDLVGQVAKATEGYAVREKGASNAIADAIDGIVTLYPNHIWKEDQMVFPMAEKMMPADDLADLYTRFEEVEARNPPDSHEHFHSFAERIEAASSNKRRD